MLPLGLGFLGFPDLRGMVEAGRKAEQAGFESAWVAETRITRDAVTAMTALLLGTQSMRVGSAAINVFTRGAALTAITWATLAEAAPGRVVLGVGPGSPTPLAQQGYEFTDGVRRLREFVEAVRAAWSATPPIDYRGRYVQFESLMPELQPDQPPAVYFGVTGPRALDCAGALADGVILNAFMPPSYVVRAKARLAAAAGGQFAGEIGGAIVVAMADSVPEAAARVRPILATYLVYFPNLARETGIDPEFLDRIRARAQQVGLPSIFPDLPDTLVQQHALCGPADVCRARLAEYRQAGLELPVLFPDPQSLEPAIEGLAGA
ncbi:MAG TPA: LLM class flavin-dependent oxidoreductase [Chloroflexota bacterium]|jgi:5,10-methylenetetrahydromethanopterin reductase